MQHPEETEDVTDTPKDVKEKGASVEREGGESKDVTDTKESKEGEANGGKEGGGSECDTKDAKGTKEEGASERRWDGSEDETEEIAGDKDVVDCSEVTAENSLNPQRSPTISPVTVSDC